MGKYISPSRYLLLTELCVITLENWSKVKLMLSLSFLPQSMLNSEEGESHFTESREQGTSQRDWMQGQGGSISIQNTEELVFVNERVSSNHKFDTSNAAWALGSVIFLCVVLGGVLLYTRPWQNRDHWWRGEDYNSNTKFSLMKTRGHRWKSRTFPSKKTSGYTRLLNSIPEEFEDDI